MSYIPASRLLMEICDCVYQIGMISLATAEDLAGLRMASCRGFSCDDGAHLEKPWC